jgi:hypothetical protein
MSAHAHQTPDELAQLADVQSVATCIIQLSKGSTNQGPHHDFSNDPVVSW